MEEVEPKGLPSLFSRRRSIKDDFFLMPATLGYFLGDSGWGALTPGDPQSLLNTILILLLKLQGKHAMGTCSGNAETRILILKMHFRAGLFYSFARVQG